jgi:hypothetical protein
MRHPLIAVTLILIGCSAALVACGNPDLEKTQKQLIRLQSENDMLQQQYSDLQRRNNELEDELENLKAKQDEWKQWTQELAAAIGPSIWSPGIYERPIPIQFFKKASPAQLIQALNQHLKSLQLPQVKLLGVRDHSAVVQVEHAEQLTQNMGTTGAESYLGAVTYTLCSLEQIQCVDFKFAPGTHAVPGPYCR